MSFKFTFREITPEDTEILRILKLRNAKPEEHICCEILRGDGITMKTWYSKADVALWGEDYIKANSKMKYIDGDWTVSLDVEPWKRTHGVSSKKVTSPSSPRYPTWLTGHVKEWAEKRLPMPLQRDRATAYNSGTFINAFSNIWLNGFSTKGTTGGFT